MYQYMFKKNLILDLNSENLYFIFVILNNRFVSITIVTQLATLKPLSLYEGIRFQTMSNISAF